eukprot:TRINITY_DN3311_c0_g1_i1.p1 TRINITY_DN3311_c0_g1~~TRINITY_DN3311_c0_g1_i1.p1  ORF type:complete len:332 (+),score=141.78 TRINITY_DN3311_c0_g1_i1:114-998(+)
MQLGMQAGALSNTEEEALFEEWLRDGKGRMREVAPKPFASFAFRGGAVVLNVGSCGLIDDTHAAEGDVPFQIAAPRVDGQDGATCVDAVVHPVSLKPAGSVSFLQGMVRDIARGVAGEFPGVLDPNEVPSRVAPRPLDKVVLEISEAQMARGRKVMDRAVAMKQDEILAKRKWAPRPGTLLSMIPPQPIPQRGAVEVALGGRVAAAEVEVYYAAHPAPALEVVLRGVVVETVALRDPPPPASLCRAHLIPGTGLLRVAIFDDEDDARAASLRRKLEAARRRRRKQKVLPGGGSA